MTNSTPENNKFRKIDLLIIAVIVVSTLVILLPGLGTNDIGYRSIEAYRAEIVKEMVVSGDILLPQLNYQPFPTKPPLSYWWSAAFGMFSGDNLLFSIRLSAVVLAIFFHVLIFLMCLKLLDRRIGFIAAMVTVINPFTYNLAASVHNVMDYFTAISTLIAVWSFLTLREKKSLTAGYGFFIAIGIALLAKGPFIFAYVLPPIILFSFIDKKDSVFRRFPLWQGAIVLLLFTVPWIVSAYLKHPDIFNLWWDDYIGSEISNKASGDYQRDRGSLFSVFHRWTNFIPWVFYTVAAILLVVIKNFKSGIRKVFSGTEGFMLLWLIIPTVILMIPKQCPQRYILPSLPAAAVLAAIFLDKLLLERGKLRTWLLNFPALIIAVLSILGGICGVIVGCNPDILKQLANSNINTDLLIDFGFPDKLLTYGIIVSLVGIVAIVSLVKKQTGQVLTSIFCTVAVIIVFAVQNLMPLEKIGSSAKDFTELLKKEVGDHPLQSMILEMLKSVRYFFTWTRTMSRTKKNQVSAG